MSHMRPLFALCASLGLAGCLSFGGKPPERLITLTPAASLPAQTSRTAPAGQALTVAVPTVPQELNTLRIPVRTGATEVAYLKEAQWVELPNALFARLVSETIAVTTGRVVLDPRQSALDPGLRLTGGLKAFGLDASAMEVVLVYDAALVRMAGQVETRRFEARIPVSRDDAAGVAPALNQAANQVASEVAQWVGN